MDEIIIEHLNSTVYELMRDTSNGQVKMLAKQTNNDILATSLHMEQRKQTTMAKLKEEFETFFMDHPEELKIMRGYPLREDRNEDKVFDFDIVYGTAIRIVRPTPDRNRVVVVPEGATQEEITRIKQERLQPYPVEYPFILAMPKTDNLMYEISINHTPQGAITDFDSTENIPAPEPTEENVPNIPLDINGYSISNDEFKLRVIVAAYHSLLEEAMKKDPSINSETWRPDLTTLATNSGFENIDDMKDFIAEHDEKLMKFFFENA